MTKAAVVHSFWNGFGLKAYEESAVPTGENAPAFPYITYSFSTDSLGREVAMSASLWYRDTAWKPCNDKTDEVSVRIGRGGIVLPCDGGAVWIKRGQPFAQSMGDPADELVKRKYINVSVEYLTAD